MPVSPLPPQSLRKTCSLDNLDFETTEDIQSLEKVLGQPRAFKALELGSEVSGKGFNIFVMGVPDSGRTTLSRAYLERRAASDPIPDDWCYVANFKDPRKPKAIRLPAGDSGTFKSDIEKLIKQVKQQLRTVFSSDHYKNERKKLTESLQQKQEQFYNELKRKVRENQFRLSQTPVGFALVPIKKDGKPLGSEEMAALSPQKQEEIEQTKRNLEKDVQSTLDKINQLGEEIQEKVEELNEQTAQYVVQPLIEKRQETYAASGDVIQYLKALQQDILNNLEKFLKQDEKQQAQVKEWFTRYEVNVIVDNADREGAPVILESYPSYHNLVGRIDHRIVMGTSQTDFTLIRPGAFHRANGGYLLIPARDMLVNPYAWEGLKRALRDREIRILELGSQAGMISTMSLEPEPIPLDIKIVLLGTPLLYYLLREEDEDFAKLFKIRAEFATEMDRTPENESDYALFVKSVVDRNHLPPFDKTAVARLIEHGSRLAEDQEKLTTRLGKITNLIQEAAYWAQKEDLELVTGASVTRAVQEGVYRNNLMEEITQEMISQGTVLISVSGQEIGQVNGLSVLSVGDYSFGKPSRITAVSRPGNEGVVNIERQADLSGPIHIKGMLILEGYLGKRFARKDPLNLTASITFEQSYSDIDGDSASAAELYALLSAIAEVPVRQDVAVTGSINQHGKIQAVGGINEKIEGFFSTCQEQGLTGTQGVVIPEANIRHLMLTEDVVQAVGEGQFHIWPIRTFEEGVPILTGLEAGEADRDGNYPSETFHFLVEEKLKEYRKLLKKREEED